MSKDGAPVEKFKMPLCRGWDVSEKLVGCERMKEEEVSMHACSPTLINSHTRGPQPPP